MMQPKINNGIIRLKLFELLIEISPECLTVTELHRELMADGISCTKKTVYNAIGDITAALKRSRVYTFREAQVERGKNIKTYAVCIDRIK